MTAADDTHSLRRAVPLEARGHGIQAADQRTEIIVPPRTEAQGSRLIGKNSQGEPQAPLGELEAGNVSTELSIRSFVKQMARPFWSDTESGIQNSRFSLSVRWRSSIDAGSDE